MADVDLSVINLSTELIKKENKRVEQVNEYAHREQEKKEILIPVIEDMRAKIQQLQKEHE